MKYTGINIKQGKPIVAETMHYCLEKQKNNILDVER